MWVINSNGVKIWHEDDGAGVAEFGSSEYLRNRGFTVAPNDNIITPPANPNAGRSGIRGNISASLLYTPPSKITRISESPRSGRGYKIGGVPVDCTPVNCLPVSHRTGDNTRSRSPSPSASPRSGNSHFRFSTKRETTAFCAGPVTGAAVAVAGVKNAACLAPTICACGCFMTYFMWPLVAESCKSCCDKKTIQQRGAVESSYAGVDSAYQHVRALKSQFTNNGNGTYAPLME